MENYEMNQGGYQSQPNEMNQGGYQSQPNGMNQGYQNGQWQQYPNQPQQSGKMGLCIASLVLGLLSILCCWIYGGVLGFVGVVLGIVALVKKEDKKGMAIAGIITSVVGIILLIVILISAGLYSVGKAIISDPYTQEVLEQTIEDLEEECGDGSTDKKVTEDRITGKRFKANDDSMIYFEEDGTYIWYQDDAEHTDNYIAGTYEVYFENDAEKYIVNDLSKYDVTEDELDEYFVMNATSDYYDKDNLVCLMLHAEHAVADGEDKGSYDSPYIGFIQNGYFEATNMIHQETVYFTECTD